MRFAPALCLGLLVCFAPILSGAEDPKTEVIGKWVSQDEDREPLLFEKDGTFKCGFIKEKGEWVTATGKYTIFPDGEIRAEAKRGGATLYLHYTLKDGVIQGSRGPRPLVKWRKVKE